ncbi:Protein of unknown function DUF4817 [Trinorchestia longiramus]|nr:Protein of unknown function DUF4817 [Trinorchestia longiramus]
MTKTIVMHLTNEQRIFINNVYAERKSLKEVQNEFEQRFPERSSPTKKTVWKTVNKFRTHGTNSNLNKGNSGRLKTARTNENIERVRHEITENPKWYARAFQVIREHFWGHEQFIFCYFTLSTWECEQGFLVFMTIKSKSRNRLDAPEHDFRCAVSKVMPRIDQLGEKKQIQPSH